MEEQAGKAAEAIAAYGAPFARTSTQLPVLQVMVAGLFAIVAITVPPGAWLLLRIAAKVGAL